MRYPVNCCRCISRVRRLVAIFGSKPTLTRRKRARRSKDENGPVMDRLRTGHDRFLLESLTSEPPTVNSPLGGRALNAHAVERLVDEEERDHKKRRREEVRECAALADGQADGELHGK